MKDAACVRREGSVRIEQVRDLVHNEYDLNSERLALGWRQGERSNRGTASFLGAPNLVCEQTQLDACKTSVLGKSTE
jgi:hypothetical protein